MAAAEALIEQFRVNVEAGPYYDDGTLVPEVPEPRPVRLIAFYLPQFHAIAENDQWWGAGFTEWTNVTKALPRFTGHYQPRLPGALGFYDLSHSEILRRQAELARAYGLEGFCFHHYWFAGRRLLERPLENLLADRRIDLPFCVNWANENWTRRWDGSESSILLAQNHTPEDDLAFARSLEPLFDDPRYIRISGRPLLMLYRPSLLPDAAATVLRWREHFDRKGENPFIVMPQVFDDNDPRRYGMDAAAGFPPHRARSNLGRVFPDGLFDAGYRSDVISYDELARESAAYRPAEFRLFPGVCPDWDNEARSPGRGQALLGSTPAKYGAWLEMASRWAIDTAPPEERIVFINAWNEWAEGTYLEPDRHHGHAYLAETARALSRIAAHPAGSEAFGTAFVQAADRKRSPLPVRAARRIARKASRGADWIARRLRSL